MTKILTIAAIALLGLAAPALATENSAATTTAGVASSADTSVSASSRGRTSAARGADKIYCAMMEQSTGTRLRSRKCLTTQEWLERGVDITEKQ